MKILFLARKTLYSNAGGDTIQILKTAEYLKKLGISVTIHLSGKKIDYGIYDVIHFFNIIRPAEILFYSGKSQLPYVISTIFVDYSEFEKKASKGIRKIIFKYLSPDIIEYFKVLGRYFINGEKIPGYRYLFYGHRKSVQIALSKARTLLPNSNSEYKRLMERYKIANSYKVIPNAIDSETFSVKPASQETRDNNLVICVARIEPLKNQLSLIEALNNTEYHLLIIGAPSTNNVKYFKMCNKIAASNISFMRYLPQDELAKYYAKAVVHVLPSWFETTGLSSLEAAAMGCNIVITEKGDTREYFQDYAFYCDPASPVSIYDAVTKAANSPIDSKLRTKILSEYTWQNAAIETLKVYHKVLNKD